MKMQDIKDPVLLLLEDAREAESLLDREDTQFARRAYIRSTFAAFEGIIWLMKQTCIMAGDPQRRRQVSVSEYAILTDQTYDLNNKGDVNVKAKFLKLPDNFRFTVKMLNRLFRAEIDLEVGKKKWEDFKTALGIRHRITHPKNAASMSISDEEIAVCKGVVSWFNNFTHNFFQALLRASGKHQSNEVGESKTEGA